MDKFIDGIREKSNSIYTIDVITRLTHISKNKRFKGIQKMFLNNDPLKDFNNYLEIIESLKEELKAGEVQRQSRTRIHLVPRLPQTHRQRGSAQAIHKRKNQIFKGKGEGKK